MKIMRAAFAALGLVTWLDAHPAELKKPTDINVAALTAETQRVSSIEGIHLAWWIPVEFWEASLLQRPDVPAAGRDALMKSLRGYSMLAITQGKAGPLGNIEFYEREALVKGTTIELFDGKAWSKIEPLEQVPDDLKLLMKMMSPILEASLGKLGQNLRFFVLDDEVDGKRLLPPAGNSSLRVSLTNKSGEPVNPFVFEMPLDALYVPRICPNGKPAHISWVVCPWDGTKLPD